VTSSDAADPFLGYLYQLRFALLQGLKLRHVADGIAIELLDDVIVVDKNSNAQALHQLKHSIRQKASLGARSENLWKSIGNWSQRVTDNEIDIDTTNLYLTTTGRITIQSPLFYLQLHQRDERLAQNELTESAKSSTNPTVIRFAAKFLGLSKKLQRTLLEQVIVLDSQVDILAAANEISSILAIASRPEDLAPFRHALEGWFFDRAILSITSPSLRIIRCQEIRSQCVTIRDQFATDLLPVFDGLTIPRDQLADDDPRKFVRQLQIINSARNRIRRAQSEHFQALTHRSKWSREGKIAVEELPKFDKRLIKEWEIRHESVVERSRSGDSALEISEADQLYAWVEQHAPSCTPLYIRSTFSEPFLIRGSFQMLADRLDVGWHPRYREILGNQPES